MDDKNKETQNIEYKYFVVNGKPVKFKVLSPSCTVKTNQNPVLHEEKTQPKQPQKKPQGAAKTGGKCGVWTDEQALVLITLVRPHECLYNPKHPKYLSHPFKTTVWRQIREEISKDRANTTVEEVLAKWNSLRTYFLAEHRKKLSIEGSKGGRSGSSTDERYQSKMLLFPDMMFLKEFIEVAPMTSNIPKGRTNGMNQMDEAVDVDEPEEASADTPEKLAGPPIVKKRRTISNSGENELKSLVKVVENFADKIASKPANTPLPPPPPPATPAAVVVQDQFTKFGDLVASKLREMSPRKRANVEREIAYSLYS